LEWLSVVGKATGKMLKVESDGGGRCGSQENKRCEKGAAMVET